MKLFMYATDVSLLNIVRLLSFSHIRKENTEFRNISITVKY